MGTEAAQPERVRQFDGVVRREIAVELRVLDEGTRSVEVTASSEALDGHGDKVMQFWDLVRYELNPTVLWNHNKFGVSPNTYDGSVRPEDLMPIGYSAKTEVKGKKLHATIVLGSAEYSDIAQKVFLGCKEKIIRAVSVGFRPGQITEITDKAGNTKHFELGSEDHPNELLEISFVPIGSNPQAVAKSIEFERGHLARLAAERSAASPNHRSKAMNEEETKRVEAVEKDLAEVKGAVTEIKSGIDALNASLAKLAEAPATPETPAPSETPTPEGEKAASDALVKKLEAELVTERARAEKSDAGLTKVALDARSGKKFVPAERAELDTLAKDIGLERTLKLIDARIDLPFEKPVTVNGKKPAGTESPAPEPSERVAGGASAGLLKSASDAASKAVA